MNGRALNETLNVTLPGDEPLRSGSEVVEMLYIVLVYTMLTDKGFRFNNPCVGVLLRPNLVLTTQSCLEVSFHGTVNIDLIYVYVRNKEVLKSERVFIYPDMEQGPNLALILCEKSNVTDFPKLPENEFRPDDIKSCTLCGFGSEAEMLDLTGFTKFTLNRSDIEVCNRFQEVKEWICLNLKSVIPCRGDVGAPLLCGGAIQAIFNPSVAYWAPPQCMDTFGSTFTLLHPVVPWIQRINSSLELPVLRVLNTPWCWVGMGVTAITVIVVIYHVIMRYVEWMSAVEEEWQVMTVDTDSRIIRVHSSDMSRVWTGSARTLPRTWSQASMPRLNKSKSKGFKL